MPVSQYAVWQGDGYVNGRQYQRVRIVKETGKLIFDGRELKSNFVKFKRDFEDGYGNYQAGQVALVPSREMLMNYLEEGHCVPCDAPEETVVKDDPNEPSVKVRFLESVAMANGAFTPGIEYDLPQKRAKKYIDRGLAIIVKEPELRPAPDRKARV